MAPALTATPTGLLNLAVPTAPSTHPEVPSPATVVTLPFGVILRTA